MSGFPGMNEWDVEDMWAANRRHIEGISEGLSISCTLCGSVLTEEELVVQFCEECSTGEKKQKQL